jgi:hypothetical protein
MSGELGIVLGEEVGDLAELGELALETTQVGGVVTALAGRFHSADAVEEGAGDSPHLGTILDFRSVFEEGPHHPGVRQDFFQPFDRGLRSQKRFGR